MPLSTCSAAFHPAGQTNGASSQWFFNLRDNPAFDAPTTNGYFTVFGRVIGGTNVLNAFLGFQVWKETPQETNVIVDLCKYAGFGPDFRECPFLNGSLSPYYLVYVDISLLNVQIRNVNNAREISWTSVAGRTWGSASSHRSTASPCSSACSASGGPR